MRKKVLLAFSTFLGMVVLAELMLRFIGWSPGQFQYSQWVKPIDELIAVNGFTADSQGIFKVDTAVSNRIYHDCMQNERILDNIGGDYCETQNILPEVAALYQNHLRPEDKIGPYWQRLENILKNGCRNCLDSSILHYSKNPINNDGFYSIPFDTSCQRDRKVLLVGDSFTWGHSTSNKTLSFSNVLLGRGYHVFNTGISGADLPQYLQVIKTYVPVLKPEVIVVNVFMGNDIMDFERSPMPYMPVHFSTNAGNLLSFQGDTQLLDMHQAYDNIMSNMVVRGYGPCAHWASKSVLGALMWSVGARFGLVKQKFYQYPKSPVVPASRKSLLAIQSFCDSVKVPLVISVIPTIDGGKLAGAEMKEAAFQGVEYQQPSMDISLYRTGDGHFNDQGHLFYADYLQDLLEEKLGKQSE